MAHPTPIPAAQNSDWLTFLSTAFINGLNAYGASLMTVGAPEPALTSPKNPSHLGTGETNPNPAGPKPAACPIHRAASPRNGRETMNSVLDWTRA